MNEAAKQHLDNAIAYALRGDEYYAKCADEIIAAQEADPTIGLEQIAQRFGRSRRWVRALVTSRTNWQPDAGPFAVDWERGSHATTAEIEAGAQKLLASKPLELVERMVEELPAKQAAAVATAALRKPGVAREIAADDDASKALEKVEMEYWKEVEEQGKRKTRKERKKSGIGGAVDSLGTLLILGTLSKAKGLLAESYEGAKEVTLTDDMKGALEEVLGEISAYVDWYRSLLASDSPGFQDEVDRLLS